MKLRRILKLAFVAGIISCASNSGFAQGAYVKLGSSYNFGAASDNAYNREENITYTSPGAPSPTSHTIKFERKQINLGKGLQPYATIGYMFSNRVGTELGIGYLFDKKNKVRAEQTVTGYPYPFSPIQQTRTYIHTEETYARMLTLQPSLVLSFGTEKFNPYARFGLIITKGTVYLNVSDEANEIEMETEYTGGWGTGMQAGIGADYKLNEKLAVFSEISMNNLSYRPAKRDITKFYIRSEDRLSSMSTVNKETEYQEDFEVNINKQSENSPQKAGKFSLPFSTIGIHLGLKYNF